MIEANKQDLKPQTSEKWNYCESIPLQNLLSTHYCLPLRHMDKNIVMNVRKKKIFTISSRVYVRYWIKCEWGIQITS